jgi:hypothetical protein|tara:strand:+ start:577 stop:1128 length:552 start_codon:yes stop_codon:yes gene_type:complete
MAFWTTTPERDPKRNFRFQIFITGVQGTEPAVWWAKKVAKPNFTIAESKHVYMGHTFYYPGKVEWQAISMTLVDPVDPGSLFRINQIIRSGGYVVPGDANQLTTQSKAKTNGAIGKVAIRQLDAGGTAIETWELHNPFIKKVAFSELDYENDDISTIDLEFRYDWATCETADQGALGTFFEAE